MLPTAADLDDPDGFVHREALDIDFSELDKMLGEASGPDAAPGTDAGGTDGDSGGEDGTGDGPAKGDGEK
jgi:hypothetical protein